MAVVKKISLVGTSPVGWHEAVQGAVRTAARTLRHLHELEVTRLSARVEGDQVVEYRAEIRLAFRVEET